MEVQEAQREVRSVYMGGFVGQIVSGVLWLVSAGLGTWVSTSSAIWTLVLGGTLIFPLTQLVLKLMGRRASLSKGNPFQWLAMQTAFIVPLSIPVIGGAALYRTNWFYPAFLIILGAHYLPFMTLYGMWQFGVLGGVLIAAGLMIGMYLPTSFALGGWIGGAALLLYAVAVARMAFRQERA